MIRFFRRIKQELFLQGRFSRYIFYAVGEIILVVIGILIALQVNNWNEKRKLSLVEIALRTDLTHEFSSNLVKLKRQINRGENMVEANKKMLSITGPQFDTIEDLDFEQLFYSVSSGTPHFSPRMTAFNEMLLSGNFKAILDPELRRALSDWESALSEIKAKEDLCESYRINIKNIYIKTGSLINEWIITKSLDSMDIDPGPYQFAINNKNMLLNPEFENNVVFRYGNLKDLVIGYQQLKNLMEQIIELCSKNSTIR